MTDSGLAPAVQPSPLRSPYLIDAILHEHEVHIISGPSGAGKTVLALQIASDFLEGREVFGHAVSTVPLCYIACERSKASLKRTMSQLDIPCSTIPHDSLIHPLRRDESRTLDDAFALARRVCPSCKLLFLDGLASLCPGRITDYRELSHFLIGLSKRCKHEQITVVGIVYSSKVRDGSGYIAPRDRIAGSAAWSTLTDTKILIEPLKPSNPADPNRVVSLLPTSHAAEVFAYQFVGGRLLPTSEANCPAQADLDRWLAGLPESLQVCTQDIVEAGSSAGLSRTTIYRWIDDQVSLGTMLRVSRGWYRKAPSGVVQ